MCASSALRRRSRFPVVGAALVAACLSACGGSIEVGSDVTWTARFEGGTFDEWTGTPGGGTNVSSATGRVAVSDEHAHAGRLAARLSIDAPLGAGSQAAGMLRRGDLPTEAYYSAWYFVPLTANVGQYWVIFKFRLRDVADDPFSDRELFDVGVSGASGEMTLNVFDHRMDQSVPLRAGLVVPVGVWFQIEAYYRNASDSSGALMVWFDGEAVVDLEGTATSPTPWVEWDVLNLGNDLTPTTSTLFVDDCAVSRRRVGPEGRISD